MSRMLRGKFVRSLTITLVCIASAIAACAPGTPEETELQRMLAYLPPFLEHPSAEETTVSFANPAELKRLHGFAEDITPENVPQDRIDEFFEVVQSAGVCLLSMSAYIAPLRPQMDLGYNVMTVKRCIDGSGVTVMEGDFDPQHVAASLEGSGYDVDEYEGVTTYHFNAENYTGDAMNQRLIEMAGHVAAVKGAIITATTPERLHAALDTWTGRGDNLSNASQYAVLTQTLGPVFSATLLPTEDQLVGMGYQEITQQERYIILASTHATAEEAESEGERLVENLESHSLARRWQVREPTITDFEEGAILTISLELNEDAPGGIPGELFLLGFR